MRTGVSVSYGLPAFMGEQIVEAGGYSASFAPAIGWAVHLGVSLSYALLRRDRPRPGASRFPAQVAMSFAVAGQGDHVGFFLLNWLVQGLGPRLLRVGATRNAAVGL